MLSHQESLIRITKGRNLKLIIWKIQVARDAQLGNIITMMDSLMLRQPVQEIHNYK